MQNNKAKQGGEELTQAETSKAQQARDLFDRGFIPESLEMLKAEIASLERSQSVAGAENEGKNSALIVPLRLLLVKLLLKTGFLADARSILAVKVLNQAELPIMLKAQGYYLSGKLGFYENAYAQSIRDH